MSAIVGTAVAGPRGTPFQRLRARIVAVGAWLVGRAPEGLCFRVADVIGAVAYRTASGRRDQARANLARVAAWAAATGTGRPDVRAAADDPARLERLVRAAFRHHARYWVELIRAPRMTTDWIRERVRIADRDVWDSVLARGGPVIFIGLHMGAIELPGFYMVRLVGRPVTGPMEAVADPALQRWFLATRSSVGLRLVGLREARRELLAALRDGGIVGLVADRDLTGGGIPTPFFGRPAPLPAGPGLLVVETGAPAVAVVVRRTLDVHYVARLEALPVPEGATRRDRVAAFLAAEAAAFERFILEAPEQWWGAFYPIWPDGLADETGGAER